MAGLFCRLGDTFYSINRKWPKLPPGHSFAGISDVAADSDGNIFVLQRDRRFMLVFSQDGELTDCWENDGILDGHKIHVDSNDRIFVVDRDRHRVLLLDRSGDILRIIGDERRPGAIGTPFHYPTHLTSNEEGELFIADGYGNYCIHHFSSSGTYLHSWGKPGDGPGAFSIPHSIDSKKRILVADRENNRIQFFDQNGYFIKQIDVPLFHPMALAENRNAVLFVTDQTPRMHAFDTGGALIGTCKTFGTYAHGIACDIFNNLYTAEMSPNWITKFEPSEQDAP